MTPHTHDWLAALPERAVAGEQTIVHGSPRQPIWEYLLRPAQAAANFAHFDSAICFVGHTHVPTVFAERRPGAASPSTAPRPARRSR